MRKILIPILLFPLVAVFANKSRVYKILKEELLNLVPIKAIVGLILNALLDLFTIFSGGLNYFHFLSGDITRWVVGDDFEKDSFGKRISVGAISKFLYPVFTRYVLQCKQPFFALLKDPKKLAIDMGYHNNYIYARIHTDSHKDIFEN